MRLRSTVEVIEVPAGIGHGDPLYLFFCHLEWQRTKKLAAREELLAALDDTDPDIRLVAEVLLHQDAPPVEATSATADSWEGVELSRGLEKDSMVGRLADIRR